MKRIDHPVAVSLGLVALGSLGMTAPLVSHTHDAVYHMTGSASALFLPVLLDVCVCWLVVGLLLWWAQRWSGLRVVVWGVVFSVLPIVGLKNWTMLTERSVSRGTWIFAVIFPVIVVVGFRLWARHERAGYLGGLRSLAESVLGTCSLFGVLVLVQLVWFGWQARDLNPAPILHVALNGSRRQVTSSPSHSRVIWILLDELSYQQVYEQRFPGLQLPAFDRLAAESSVFTYVKPAGYATSYAVPALLTGEDVDKLDVSDDGRLRALHDPGVGKWRDFKPSETIFEDALERGYSTGVAGWFNPYCRIFAAVLDHCFWVSQIGYVGHMFPERTIVANAMGPLRWVGSQLHRALLQGTESPDSKTGRSATHLADYWSLAKAGDDLLADSSCDFVFLHMPIPHPGGIFDRRRGQFVTSGASYVDNLALADRYLAHVRELLQGRGKWDGSTVLVMADHSWRTKTWIGTPDWMEEDQVASHGGVFDDRPMYLVKLPQQHEGSVIETEFAAVRTRALVDAILAGRLRTAGELQAWVTGAASR